MSSGTVDMEFSVIGGKEEESVLDDTLGDFG
jgi:hypothetical protein